VVEEEPQAAPLLKLVVDANLVFSCIVRSDGNIGEVLIRSADRFEFFAPSVLQDELERHRTELRKMARMSEADLGKVLTALLGNITLIDEKLWTKTNLRKAEKLLDGVDLLDVPYLALAFDLDCPLWTGDKKLIKGLRAHGVEHVLSTEDVLKFL